MKLITPLFLVVGLLTTSGCISTHLVENKAKSHSEYDAETLENKQVEGQPAYYALLPLTIVGDIATSPFQLAFLLFSTESSSGEVSVHGWPIPLF